MEDGIKKSTILPPMMPYTFVCALREAGVEVRTSVGEADAVTVEYCKLLLLLLLLLLFLCLFSDDCLFVDETHRTLPPLSLSLSLSLSLFLSFPLRYRA